MCEYIILFLRPCHLACSVMESIPNQSESADSNRHTYTLLYAFYGPYLEFYRVLFPRLIWCCPNSPPDVRERVYNSRWVTQATVDVVVIESRMTYDIRVDFEMFLFFDGSRKV